MSDPVLVLNAGSSSLKYRLVDPATGRSPAGGSVQRIGERTGMLRHRGPEGEREQEQPVADHEQALTVVTGALRRDGLDLSGGDGPRVAAVGHRVVHGGDRFTGPALVDDGVLEAIRALAPLAPLHNPANADGIEVARRLLPEVPQVAVFDTAFHATLPPRAATYAVPRAWREQHGVRRYGFHGTSYAFVAREAARLLGRRLEQVDLVLLHLGNGCSATAVAGGRSVDTSMGITPLEGLVMGTRSGDVDPALAGHLHRTAGLSVAEVDEALNHASGLAALAGDNDVRTLLRRRAAGDADAGTAFDVYCYRIRKYVGAYLAALGGADAVVFTAGVGQYAAPVREAALAGLEALGVRLDPQRNAQASGDEPARVSADGSPVAVLVVPTDEEWEIARQTLEVVRTGDGCGTPS